MGHVAQQTSRITDNLVVCLSLDMADKSYTTRILFIFRVIQSLRRRESRVDGIRVSKDVFETIKGVGGERKGEITSRGVF